MNVQTRARRIANIETRIESAIEEIECALGVDEDFLRALDSDHAVNDPSAHEVLSKAKVRLESALYQVRARLRELDAAQEGSAR